jgi:hypothetical protein
VRHHSLACCLALHELSTSTDHTFSALSREDHTHIEEYLQDKKVKVKNEITDDLAGANSAVAAALLSDDESMESAASEDERPKKAKKGDEMDVDSQSGLSSRSEYRWSKWK